MAKEKRKAAAKPAAATAPVAKAAPKKTAPAPAIEVVKKDSFVDGVFDKVTLLAARGLTAAKRGLEASARWLDGRAKLVGDLAAKLEPANPTV